MKKEWYKNLIKKLRKEWNELSKEDKELLENFSKLVKDSVNILEKAYRNLPF